MIAAYAALGVDPVEAVAGTLLFRGLHYLAVLGRGLPSLAFHELAAGPRRPAAAARTPVRDPDRRAPEPL